MPTLDEIVIEGWRTAPYGPGLDPALFATWQYVGDPTPPDNSFFGGGGGSETQESFVAPVAPPITAPPLPPEVVSPAAAPIAEVLVNAVRTIAPVVSVLLPTPIASEPAPELLTPFNFEPFVPQSPEPLPELVVTGTRPPPPPPVFDPQFDAYEPPNWRDLYRDYQFYPDFPTFPFSGIEVPSNDAGLDYDLDSFRRVDLAPSAPRSDPAPSRRAAPDAPGRSPRERRVGAPAPDVLGTPFADPFGFPFASPADLTGAAPRTDVGPRISDPVLDPIGDPGLGLDPFTPAAPAPATPTSPRAPITGVDPFEALPPPLEDPLADPKKAGCDCETPKLERDPDKPKRKKKPRTRCYRGTYTEKSSSLTKSPKEEIPCR